MNEFEHDTTGPNDHQAGYQADAQPGALVVEDFPDHLSAHDAAAMDAWVESGWRADAVSPETLRPRAARLAALLAPLAVGPAFRDPSLEDVLLLRLARLRAACEANPELCADDQDALDALSLADGDTRFVPRRLRPRAARLLALAGLAASAQPAASTADADDLIARTLAHVQSSIDRAGRDMTFKAMAGPPPAELRRRRMGGVQFADLVSMAALLLIGTAVVWPMMATGRERARELACAGSMRAASLGFGAYAGDNRDALPMASASLAGNPWWHVGFDPRFSNSANLYRLVPTEYARLPELACPGNPAACRDPQPPAGAADWRSFPEVSYSYQNMFAKDHARWNCGPRTVVMADRSPVVVKAIRGQVIDPLGGSLNHGERGQNVLSTDGASVWMTTPVLPNGDNIWLPRCIEQVLARFTGQPPKVPLCGVESPECPEDAFVGP